MLCLTLIALFGLPGFFILVQEYGFRSVKVGNLMAYFKAEGNFNNHGSFELAKTVFRDPFAIERLDDREDYREMSCHSVVIAEGHVLLFVAYTEREECIRLLSPRRQHSR